MARLWEAEQLACERCARGVLMWLATSIYSRLAAGLHPHERRHAPVHGHA